MTPTALIFSETAVDFPLFLKVTHQALGYSPAATVDASSIQRTDTERFLSCLAAFRDERAPAGLTPNLLRFATFGLLIAAEERDMIDILNACTAMPAISVDSTARGIIYNVVFGTLADWRDAVKTGSAQDAEFNVRSLFNHIMVLFQGKNLDVWKNDFQQRPMADKTFYLEDKRR